LLASAAPAAFAAVGCKPDLDQTVSIVGDPIVLDVKSEPAEADPLDPMHDTVQLTALYVDRDGPIANGDIDWAFCTARNPLANLGSVNPQCLEPGEASWFVPIGQGPQVTGALPTIACRQFGPDVPEPTPGQPQGRPVDPDPTGGYYQPARLTIPSDAGALTGIAETRLICGNGLATGSAAPDYNRRYHPNTNPAVASLRIVTGSTTSAPLTTDGPADGGAGGDGGVVGGSNTIMAGAHVTFRAAWAACPTSDVCGDDFCGPDESTQECPADCTTPLGCSGAERFAEFDVPSQSVVDARESINVAWFATGGSFDADRTGRDSTDTTSSSDNGWTAPSSAGTVHLWVVLRDDRGGSGWGEYTILVR
jgi:hypothetical protein